MAQGAELKLSRRLASIRMGGSALYAPEIGGVGVGGHGFNYMAPTYGMVDIWDMYTPYHKIVGEGRAAHKQPTI